MNKITFNHKVKVNWADMKYDELTMLVNGHVVSVKATSLFPNNSSILTKEFYNNFFKFEIAKLFK